AWQIGCKGVTVFRDGCKRLGILTPEEKKAKAKSAEAKKEQAIAAAVPGQNQRGVIKTVSDNVIGKKRKLMTGCGSLHCTAFFDPVSGDLMEAYLNKGSTGGCNNFMIGLSRMISLAARSGCDINAIVDQLKSCGSCPSFVVRTFTKKDTSKGSCCPMAVGWALLDMYDEMQRQVKGATLIAPAAEPEPKKKIINPCPKCGDELTFQGGCNVCRTCGWTRCE
ncbi:MAG: ribonucleoside-diphosphate reductase, adenosylcobalamin-dependent, partial [Methanomethylophilus sp.]